MITIPVSTWFTQLSSPIHFLNQMASTYLAVNMSESADLSKSQRIERDLSVSSLECDERKQNRKEVAIFVKVLLDYLERANELELKQLTKAAISECVFQHQFEGSPERRNLAHAIQTKVRTVVGESHWTRAKLIILYARQSARRKIRESSKIRTELASRSA